MAEGMTQVSAERITNVAQGVPSPSHMVWKSFILNEIAPLVSLHISF
jgi:hypothetical protein